MDEKFPTLFSHTTIAGKALSNRIALAPLTRQLAENDGTPTDEMAAYYARRARGGASLIFTEGVYFSENLGCKAYLSQPGITNAKHVDAWRKAVDAIHANGSIAIVQLMHGGRVSDPRCLRPGEQPVSASALQSPGCVLYTDSNAEKELRGIAGNWEKIEFGPARELSTDELEQIADEFAEAAVRAVEAGFDGVEIHGGNGYLLYQFLHDRTNHRSDEFGGSVAGRIRFPLLVIEKVRRAIGRDRIITLRMSQDGVDDFTGAWQGGVETARSFGRELRQSSVDAIHWASFDWRDNRDPGSSVPMPQALKESSGLPVIVNGGIVDGSAAEEVLTSGAGDMVAIGRPMFAHPDWPAIIRSGAPFEFIPFDRKYVIRPPVELDYAYEPRSPSPEWPA